MAGSRSGALGIGGHARRAYGAARPPCGAFAAIAPIAVLVCGAGAQCDSCRAAAAPVLSRVLRGKVLTVHHCRDLHGRCRWPHGVTAVVY